MQVALRPYSEGDFWLLERLLGDPAMMTHLGGPETPEQLRKRHARYLQAAGSDTTHIFVVTLGKEETPAGSVVYWERPLKDETVWEVGWSVLPEFQRRGVATKGASLAMEQARSQARNRFVHASPSVDNVPSNGVCRKLGFELLGELDLEYPPGHHVRCNDWQLDLSAHATQRP
jgi:RimJ/RimL family protein N-acetyltransferase